MEKNLLKELIEGTPLTCVPFWEEVLSRAEFYYLPEDLGEDIEPLDEEELVRQIIIPAVARTLQGRAQMLVEEFLRELQLPRGLLEVRAKEIPLHILHPLTSRHKREVKEIIAHLRGLEKIFSPKDK